MTEWLIPLPYLISGGCVLFALGASILARGVRYAPDEQQPTPSGIIYSQEITSAGGGAHKWDEAAGAWVPFEPPA